MADGVLRCDVSAVREAGDVGWARDPDSIVVLTPHEELDCFTVTSILRNLPQQPEFLVSWDYPLMRVANDLNPYALRRPQGRNKVCTDKEFLEAVLGDKPKSFSAVIDTAASQLEMSRATAKRYLNRLKESGVICCSGGIYWAAHQSVTDN